MCVFACMRLCVCVRGGSCACVCLCMCCASVNECAGMCVVAFFFLNYI